MTLYVQTVNFSYFFIQARKFQILFRKSKNFDSSKDIIKPWLTSLYEVFDSSDFIYIISVMGVFIQQIYVQREAKAYKTFWVQFY